MLREAVKNVLDNAVRHGRAGAGGGIVIRLFTDRADGARCLSVSDGGPGIAEPDRARAFERFQRGSATDAPGSGLGLAIVKRVVDAHGGRLDLADRPGGGLAVTLRFPSSEERRVGKEGVLTFRSRGSTAHKKKK